MQRQLPVTLDVTTKPQQTHSTSGMYRTGLSFKSRNGEASKHLPHHHSSHFPASSHAPLRLLRKLDHQTMDVTLQLATFRHENMDGPAALGQYMLPLHPHKLFRGQMATSPSTFEGFDAPFPTQLIDECAICCPVASFLVYNLVHRLCWVSTVGQVRSASPSRKHARRDFGPNDIAFPASADSEAATAPPGPSQRNCTNRSSPPTRRLQRRSVVAGTANDVLSPLLKRFGDLVACLLVSLRLCNLRKARAALL